MKHVQGWAHYTGTFLIVADPVIDRAIDLKQLTLFSQNMYNSITKRFLKSDHRFSKKQFLCETLEKQDFHRLTLSSMAEHSPHAS